MDDSVASHAGKNPKRVDGLEINPAEDGYIIYQPELDRVHFLNATAVLVLELCNGNNSEEAIVDLIRSQYELKENPAGIVKETLAKMKAEGLLQ